MRVRPPLRSNWRDDRRVVPSLRRAAASLRDAKAASPQKWAPTEHRPPSFSSGAAAPLSHGAPPFVPNGRVGSPQRTQDSGAQRRLCWMQRRLRRKNGASTAIRPYLGLFDGRCRADCAFGAPFVPNGGMTFALLAPCSLRPSGHLRCASSAPPGASVVSSQASGAQRRLRGACESLETVLHAPANIKQGRLQPMRCEGRDGPPSRPIFAAQQGVRALSAPRLLHNVGKFEYISPY